MIEYVIGRRRRRHWKGVRVLISFRGPPELHDDIMRRAKEAELSMNDYLLDLVRRTLERETKP
jgi:predicted HicB family RNase H-like nuclease